MRLFIMPNAENIGDETSGDWFVDAVVCYSCLETDYDICEGKGMTDSDAEREIEALDPAPVGSICSSCGVGSA